MSRFLKWTAGVIGAVIVLALLAYGAVYAASNRILKTSYASAPLPVVPAASPGAVEHGKHLVTAVAECSVCHGGNMAGTTYLNDPMFGRIVSANLTTGVGGVGGSYTDAQLVRAFRQGVKRDGSPIAFMPVMDFHNLSDSDATAIVAYIRSLPPVNHVPQSVSLGPVARVLTVLDKAPVLVPARHYSELAGHVPQVPAAPTPEYGRYLTGAAGCTGCHGDNFAGGAIPGAPPSWPAAPAIDAAGLRGWTEADFVRALRTGVIPGGRTLNPVMPWQTFHNMTDDELHALWLYLSTFQPRST